MSCPEYQPERLAAKQWAQVEAVALALVVYTLLPEEQDAREHLAAHIVKQRSR